MKKLPYLLLTLFVAANLMTGLIAYGKTESQSNPPQRRPGERPVPRVRGLREQPKGDVDSLLESLKKRNVRVVERCLENCNESGGTDGGQIVEKSQPVYPPDARARRIAGEVVVRVVLDEEGKVEAAQAVSGDPVLRKAAESAAKKTRFTPTKLSGQPVKVSGVISYNFVLQ